MKRSMRTYRSHEQGETCSREPLTRELLLVPECGCACAQERVGKIYYMDQNIQFLVEVKSVADLKDMCQLQVVLLAV